MSYRLHVLQSICPSIVNSMQSRCQFDKIKVIMNRFWVLIILIIYIFIPSSVAAAGIKPDIRNYDVFVEERPMPVVTCLGLTPEQWIANHIGYNQLQGNTMKFSQDLFTSSDQVEKAAEKLKPYIVKKTSNKTSEEPGNKPTWVGSICYYRDSGNGQIISEKLIEAEDPITTVFKNWRDGNLWLSAIIARGNLSLSGSIYNTQKDPLQPDPNKQSSCDVEPPGVNQAAKDDKGTGMNQFGTLFEQLKLAVACETCACEPTKMYIKTDSTIQYDTYPMCQSVGCTDELVNVVDEQSRADQIAKDSGGWINAVARPGLLQQIFQLVQTLFGNITGKVDAQTTQNKVNSPSAPSSYYTTKSAEVGMDFLNCKLYPYAKRAEMPECNTSWIQALIGSVKNSLQGTGN